MVSAVVMNIPVKRKVVQNLKLILTYYYDSEHNARYKFAFYSLLYNLERLQKS